MMDPQAMPFDGKRMIYGGFEDFRSIRDATGPRYLALAA